jgi:hypothetical protein
VNRMTLISVTATAHPQVSSVLFCTVIYVVALVTGGIVMSFEMLGSRYLNPYFGNGIYTWAALISTVLAAFIAALFRNDNSADLYEFFVSMTRFGSVIECSCATRARPPGGGLHRSELLVLRALGRGSLGG